MHDPSRDRPSAGKFYVRRWKILAVRETEGNGRAPSWEPQDAAEQEDRGSPGRTRWWIHGAGGPTAQRSGRDNNRRCSNCGCQWPTVRFRSRDNDVLPCARNRHAAALHWTPALSGRGFPRRRTTAAVWPSGDACVCLNPEPQERWSSLDQKSITGQTERRARAPAPHKTIYRPTMSPFSPEMAPRTSFFSLSGTLNLSRVSTRCFTERFQSSSVMPRPVWAVFISCPV